jgi:small GTP-binding protein
MSSNNSNKSSNPSDYQYIFKLILIGNSGVGKSSIIQRYMKNTFEESYKCTIGVDFLMKTLNLNGKTVKLQLWDTAGQEKYKSMVASYYRGANVALVVFDITNHASFDSLPVWIENYYKNGPEEKNIILIGNKKDMEESRQVTKQEAEIFSETNNMMYFETSAKEGDNIEYIFTYAAEKLLEYYGKPDENNIKRQMNDNDKLQSQSFTEIRIEEHKKGCC